MYSTIILNIGGWEWVDASVQLWMTLRAPSVLGRLARALASLGYLRNPFVLSMRSVGKFGQRASGYAGFIHSHLSLFYTPYYMV